MDLRPKRATADECAGGLLQASSTAARRSPRQPGFGIPGQHHDQKPRATPITFVANFSFEDGERDAPAALAAAPTSNTLPPASAGSCVDPAAGFSLLVLTA